MEFRQLEPRPQLPFANPPYDRWPGKGDESLSEFFRTPEGFIVRFPGFADFALAKGDWSVACTPVPGALSRNLRDLFNNQVVPLILGYKGNLVLHASAVVAKSGVLAFVGPTGRGKSTLAASFAKSGFPFLTDDGLILDRIDGRYLVKPNVPHFRLREDSELALFGGPRSETESAGLNKRRIASSRSIPFQETPVDLRAIYILGTGLAAETQIAPLKPATALSVLMAHSFILDVEDRTRVRAHFGRLAELVRFAPCFALDYPRDYGYLSQVKAAILDHAESGDMAA